MSTLFLAAFLKGLLIVLAVAAIIIIAVMCGKWLKGYIDKKLKQKEKHKVAFADTREVVDSYLKNKAEESDEISMDELERMCDETPFVSAYVDEDGNVTDYEGIKAHKVDANFKARMKQQEGMLVIER